MKFIKKKFATALAGGAIAACALAPAAQADSLTYREQQWITKNGHAIWEEVAREPTEDGVLKLLSSMVIYYEVDSRMGLNSANLIMGSIAQQCPQYRQLVPALRGTA